MSELVEKIIQPQPSTERRNGHRRLKLGFFVLEGLNALATGYYFNYLPFYLQKHFGFGDRRNLLITALYGFCYMFAAAYGGRFGKKHGYFLSLRIGFVGMGIFMALGGIAPHFLGYLHPLMLLQILIVIGWTLTMCFTWPSLQAVLSHAQTPTELPHTAGIYNMVWAGASALAYLTSGALLDRFGGEILFWVPAGIHVVQLALLPALEKLDRSLPVVQPAPPIEPLPELNPRPIARAKTFVRLAWIANPFAYMAIYGVIPIIPHLAKQFDLSPTYAGLVCSIWFWVRVGAFATFWLWAGWHYRFRWLLAAFVGLIASYIAIAMSVSLGMLIGAQVVFGLVVGLIYYSSLFYSMDVGESRGKRGGFHEAAIGLGIFVGPATGVGALQTFPNHPNAGT
ncbi:MAG TPA: MFS transporter, partial [Verrucomicrobiae bacterium]|nr:MFS transporter [Verrucomicrobiae bacterium]